jgi:hypothetical protein
MFEQAALVVQNEKVFGEISSGLKSTFETARVERFLQGVQRSRLRVRQFEGVLAAGLLGSEMSAKYAALGDSDRGQVREQYLSLLERVDSKVRSKFYKVYAYY